MSLSKVSLHCERTPEVAQVCAPAYFECVIYTKLNFCSNVSKKYILHIKENVLRFGGEILAKKFDFYFRLRIFHMIMIINWKWSRNWYLTLDYHFSLMILLNKRESLNVGKVITFRMHNVGTAQHRDPIVLWYFYGPHILNLFHMCLGLKDSDRIRYEITSYRVRFREYFRWWQFIWWQYEIFIPITSHRMKRVHTRSFCVWSE